MRSDRPKHLHPLLGRRLVDWVARGGSRSGRPARRRLLARDAGPSSTARFPRDVELAVQDEPRGTGDAVAAASPRSRGIEGDVLVLAGGTPLLTPSVLERSSRSTAAPAPRLTVLAIEPDEPLPYGRVVRDGDGGCAASSRRRRHARRSSRSASSTPPIYVFAAGRLWAALERLDTTTSRASST